MSESRDAAAQRAAARRAANANERLQRATTATPAPASASRKPTAPPPVVNEFAAGVDETGLDEDMPNLEQPAKLAGLAAARDVAADAARVGADWRAALKAQAFLVDACAPVGDAVDEANAVCELVGATLLDGAWGNPLGLVSAAASHTAAYVVEGDANAFARMSKLDAALDRRPQLVHAAFMLEQYTKNAADLVRRAVRLLDEHGVKLAAVSVTDSSSRRPKQAGPGSSAFDCVNVIGAAGAPPSAEGFDDAPPPPPDSAASARGAALKDKIAHLEATAQERAAAPAPSPVAAQPAPAAAPKPSGPEPTLLEHATAVVASHDKDAPKVVDNGPQHDKFSREAKAVKAHGRPVLYALGFVGRCLPDVKDAVDEAGAIARIVKALLDAGGGDPAAMMALMGEKYSVADAADLLRNVDASMPKFARAVRAIKEYVVKASDAITKGAAVLESARAGK